MLYADSLEIINSHPCIFDEINASEQGICEEYYTSEERVISPLRSFSLQSVFDYFNGS